MDNNYYKIVQDGHTYPNYQSMANKMKLTRWKQGCYPKDYKNMFYKVVTEPVNEYIDNIFSRRDLAIVGIEDVVSGRQFIIDMCGLQSVNIQDVKEQILELKLETL